MKKILLIANMPVLLITLVFSLSTSGQETESVTYEGQLRVGKTESVIVYLGPETGDLAAFCFSNRSPAGRAILARCKNRQQCRFSGRVDWSKGCGPKGDFSARARIVSVRSVRRVEGRRR